MWVSATAPLGALLRAIAGAALGVLTAGTAGGVATARSALAGGGGDASTARAGGAVSFCDEVKLRHASPTLAPAAATAALRVRPSPMPAGDCASQMPAAATASAGAPSSAIRCQGGCETAAAVGSGGGGSGAAPPFNPSRASHGSMLGG